MNPQDSDHVWLKWPNSKQVGAQHFSDIRYSALHCTVNVVNVQNLDLSENRLLMSSVFGTKLDHFQIKQSSLILS